MVGEGFDIDITLPQRAYAIFESLNYTPWNAIGEFIDNSIQSYINYKEKLKKLEKGYKLRIDIKLDQNKLEISDNASGIDEDNLKKGLKPATKPDIMDGLSEFGMGMKTAAFWLSRKWKIISKHFDSGKEFNVEFDNVKIYTEDIQKISVFPQTVNDNSHYTKLILNELSIDGLNEDLIQDLKSNLASMYRHYIRTNEIDICFNDEKLKFKSYGILRGKKVYGNKEEIDWNKKIDFTMSSGKRITGIGGLLAVSKPTRAGFTYFRRNRVIEGLLAGVKIIGILGTGNTAKSQRVFAELNLDAFRVSHTKDKILFGNEIYEFEEKLRGALEEGDIKLLKQATDFSYKNKVPTPSEEEEEEGIVTTSISTPATTSEDSSAVSPFEVNIKDFDVATIEVSGNISKFAGEMSKAYESMYKIENLLRLLIKNVEKSKGVDFLKEDNYSDADDKNTIRQINTGIARLKEDERNEGIVSIRGNHYLYYTNFNAIKNIIDLNYDTYFCDFFVKREHVVEMLEKLYAYRNNIAHNSYLNEEERNHIEIALNFFSKQLSKKINLK